MNTEIDFLKDLETDLEDVASRERIRLQRVTLQGSIRRNTGRTWMKVVGVAAAFLVVAGAIGFLAGRARQSAADKFQEVGDAVASDDGAAAKSRRPRRTRRACARRTAKRHARPPIRGWTRTHRTPPQGGGGQQQDLSKIVRDGRIGIVVPDDGFGDAVDELTLIAERYGGFVLSSIDEQRSVGNVRPPDPGATVRPSANGESATWARASGSRRSAATT